MKKPVDDNVNRSVASRLRKLELAMSYAIHCHYCPYHNNENVTRRSPKSDVRKSKRKNRQVERKFKVENAGG